jgi:ABC-2 type transport system permease protein
MAFWAAGLWSLGRVMIVRRHARLWWRCVLNALSRETEYRVNAFATMAEGAAQVTLAVVTFLVVYQFTPSIGGWTRPQALILVGMYRIVEGLINVQVAPNMVAIGGAIRRGDMDYVLLRPVSSQFLVSARTLALSECANVVIGVGITVYAVHAAGVGWSLVGLLQATVLLLCGVMLLYAVWFAIMTCSFWLVQVNNLDTLFFAVFEAARYPVAYFSSAIRALLTFVVPVAFATTFPVEALVGRLDGRLVPVGLGLTGISLVLTHLFWNVAVRSYSSASS